MKFGDLFDNIVVCAQEAKTYYELNAEGECFNRLDEIVKSINLIRDFHEKYESMVCSAAGAVQRYGRILGSRACHCRGNRMSYGRCSACKRA